MHWDNSPLVPSNSLVEETVLTYKAIISRITYLLKGNPTFLWETIYYLTRSQAQDRTPLSEMTILGMPNPHPPWGKPLTGALVTRVVVLYLSTIDLS